MYHMICNAGQTALEAFTHMGLSTSRGNTDLIGQFGSGFKFAVALLLRNGIKPILMIGTNKYVFETREIEVKGKFFNRIVIISDGKEIDLNITTDLGVMDWTDVRMAYRELVANALDQQKELNGDYNVTIKTTGEIIGRTGFTSLYIPVDDISRMYFDNLGEYFLHFSEKKLNEVIIKKPDFSPCRVYRKGVLAGKTKLMSRFDYAFQSNFKANESRTMSESNVINTVSEYFHNIGSLDVLCEYIKTWNPHHEECVENKIYGHWLWNNELNNAWTKLHGEKGVACNVEFAHMVKERGYNPILIKSEYISGLKEAGIKTYMTVLTKIEVKAKNFRPAGPYVQELAKPLWKYICPDNPMPNIMLADYGSDDTLGEYYSGVVYINERYENTHKTLLNILIEEFVHAKTESGDFTRQFQNGLIELINNLWSERTLS